MSDYKTVREGDKLTRTWSWNGTEHVDEFLIVDGEGADYWLITTSGKTYRLLALGSSCLSAAENAVESLGEHVAHCTFPGAQVWAIWEKRWKKKVASGRQFRI